jgi:aminobenzoyl-glutamate utilization protein B
VAEHKPMSGGARPRLRAQPAGRGRAAGGGGEGLARRERHPGRVRYYGCPAEEGGAAKTFMVRDGPLRRRGRRDHLAPGQLHRRGGGGSLANTRIDFTFHGPAAHAAAAPELGRSALDAVELMNVGVNYMREHMPDDARIHYAYLDAGGEAPNVVQAKATCAS